MKVFGKGINDTENAKDYQTWHSMLRRCYSPVFKKDRPTYEGCEVCDEWLRLSTFKKWYAENNVNDWELDKDLLIPGNKTYSPETCIFVPRWLNCFKNTGSRNSLKKGVKRSGPKFTARIHDPDNGPIHLGTFPTEDEAHAAWRKKKKEILLRKEQEIRGIDERIFENLKNWLESESEF